MPSGGSHPRHDNELRETIKSQLAWGLPGNAIAEHHDVSPSFVSQLNIERKTPPEVLESLKRKRGAKNKIHEPARLAVVGYLEAHPKAVRSDVVDFLKREFDIDVSVETVGRLLRVLRSAMDVCSTSPESG